MSDSTLCPECGSNPCYRICPTQDPFGGDQFAEAMDHEFNAQYDDHRERYAATAEESQYAEDPEDLAYYAAALEQDTLRPDMAAFEAAHPATDEIPF